MRIFVVILFMLSSNWCLAQLVQNIKGSIVDAETKSPLIGVNVILLNSNPIKGTTSDLDGKFKLNDVVLGRHSIQFSFLGYEPVTISNVLLSSGKELALNIEMKESITEMGPIEVVADYAKQEPLNEMALVSARSFSVEETQRYAAAVFDPARMAQNFAGVANGGNDLQNEIVVRGNSPKGILWRLEGIEIPNPNHFSDMGNSGGGISMLSSSTLSNSDFYTGAFPAEFGNATSGVFDLQFRTGNNDQRENSFMIGIMGIEASAEGPFSKKSDASYLINYRYSTTALIQTFLEQSIGDALPKYQDLSFKLNFPTKKAGTFSMFGLGGYNTVNETLEPDSTLWENTGNAENFSLSHGVGIIGANHRFLLNNKAYIKTTLATSADLFKDETTTIDNSFYLDSENYREIGIDKTTFDNFSTRLNSFINFKANSKNTIRTGFIVSHLGYKFNYDTKDNPTDDWITFFNDKGSTNFFQGYTQWKLRINPKLTLNTGFHFSYLALNNTAAFEPRLAASYQLSENKKLTFASGLHSKPEHISTYLIQPEIASGMNPNENLNFSKSLHNVIGYDQSFSTKMRLKLEVYYQSLYDVPVEAENNSNFSILNTRNVWEIVNAGPLVNEGEGKNYGIDATLERFFNDNYYFLITGSVYDSKYTTRSGKEYHTAYAGNYLLTMLGGKEYQVGKSTKNILGINAKFKLNGGNRYSPIDLQESILSQETVFVEDKYFSKKAPDYMRFDLGISYKINKEKSTHTILLDVQNTSNRQNILSQYFDSETGEIVNIYQNGILPLINYRIEF